MAYQIDQDKLDAPDMKILDLNNPPMKNIPYQAYPKMVYLHPKDKTKEHRWKSVRDEREHENAKRVGYKDTPHVPVEAAEDYSKDFEVEYETEAKRGPGRPPKSENEA